MSEDKNVAGIAAALLPAVGDVIATRFLHARAMDPDALAAVFRAASDDGSDPAGQGRIVTSAPHLPAALALAEASGDPTILIAGSLFLVGEARTLLLDAPTDPVRVSDPSAVMPG